MDPEIKHAIEFLRRHGYKVIRADRVDTLNTIAFIDDTVFAMSRAPPDEYIIRELAYGLARELPKVWTLTRKELTKERRIEYHVTVTVVKSSDADASSHQPEA